MRPSSPKDFFPLIPTKETGVRLIMDLKELEKLEPISLLGVSDGIRKEIDLLVRRLEAIFLETRDTDLS
nr:hypothetical protein [Desulfobacterales bacterium]